MSIWLRAGWRLGSVQGRYIYQSAGGDQFVGRAASGLNVNVTSFVALRPHFHGAALSDFQWDAILPGFTTFYPATFRSVIPFLLASLVYHCKWRKATLAVDHPLFLSHVWTSGTIPSLATHVLSGVLKNKISGLVATGIPPHIPLSLQVASVKSIVQKFKVEITKKLKKVPEEVGKELREHMHSSRGDPVTMDVLNNSLRVFGDTMLRRIELLTLPRATNCVAAVTGSPPTVPSTNEWWAYPRGLQTSKLSCPKGKVFDIWNLWWDGSRSDGVPPFRACTSKDFASRAEQSNFFKAKKVIFALLSCTTLSTQQIMVIDIPGRNKLFCDCLTALCHRLLGAINAADDGKRRIADMCYHSMYDQIKKQ
ncbi:hypothetical protein H310_10128 [Aphanomyces invadans]|uniref:Uncharacterized protein n=1 Tax=Aphanomyces invadans TaxID=157072 RepID=A0A024TS51_9STRA|nr:hypothetical protein H310_10128 [Aphanomyces invadans]ETV96839.1 hypothetical protein H310_10128 [Aphanomyces invadans]|eukprot:XP_008874616.1 hypothetical protein H310_10128 [Aphanomyces invadans]